jgi:SagB-type dehydrogenase family enzyme
MSNAETGQVLEYHESTKHSEVSVKMSVHHLDWENKPKPFKVYTGAPTRYLPSEFPIPRMNALVAVSSPPPHPGTKLADVSTVAELLFFAGGITRRMASPGGVLFMRAAPATGALYPIELYAVCGGDLVGLEAGIYHFGPADFSLSLLRKGDWRGVLSEYAGSHAGISSAAVTIVLTSIAARNAWKYGARSYRHWFWDGGVIGANLLATANAANISGELVLGFEDAPVNRLLGLREGQEATIAMCPMGSPEDERVDDDVAATASPGSVSNANPPVRMAPPKIDPDFVPLSPMEISSPEVWRAYEASCLRSSDEVSAWTASRLRTKGEPGERPPGPSFPLETDLPGPDVGPDLAHTILQRGSTRRFSTEHITFGQLSRTLYSATRQAPLDFLGSRKEGGREGSLLDVYLIANAVTGLPAGSYYYNRASDALEQLKAGGYRAMTGYLCLDQPRFSRAGALIFLMTRLDDVLERFGNRGYRAANFEAGVVGGKMYIAAYGQGIGASGTTFYDDAVTEFFSPHASDMAPMMAVGIGVPDYKARSGRILTGRLTRAELLAS